MKETQDKALLRALRRALSQLYDPAHLRSSQLVVRLGIDPRKDTVATLRRILTEAILALKPDAATPPEANAWRIYRVLVRRFLEQSPQDEVASDLGLGIRQYRRLEALAIGVVADHLRTYCDLAAGPIPPQPGGGETGTPSRAEELAWLAESLPSEPVDAAQAVQAVLKVTARLAEALGVRVECDLPPGLPPLAGPSTTLRQALVTVVTATIRSVPGGRVRLRAARCRWEVDLEITPLRRQSVATPLASDPAEGLEMARQLAGLLGGTLRVSPSEERHQAFTAHLRLPAAEQVTILVIDDNTDTLHLLQRYVSGSRYRFVGLRDPEQALPRAQEVAPQIIVLDVMLPKIDGWELMGRLQQHPQTRDVPIIVCSILPEEQLALSLGASGFIRKPVNRTAFLTTLDQTSR
jgi:CheY-like chemotaxis protein